MRARCKSFNCRNRGCRRGRRGVIHVTDAANLAHHLLPLHPRLVTLDVTTARLTRLLAIYRDQSVEQLEARKSALALQIQNLQNQTRQLGRENLELSGKRLEYERLKARGQRIQSLYDQLLTSLQSLDVNKQIGPESVTVYQPASDAAPLPPELGRNLLIAVLLGLGLGLAILFIVDRMDDRLNSFTELQEFFDEEVLGQMQDVLGPAVAQRRQRDLDHLHPVVEVLAECPATE